MWPVAATTSGWASRPVVRDAVLAGALLAGCVLVNHPAALVAAAGPGGGRLAAWWLAAWWAATAVALAAVALRRRWPLPMLAAATAATVAHLGQGVLPAAADLGVPILLYTVASRCRRAVSLAVMTGLLLLLTGWVGSLALAGRPVPGMPVLDIRVAHRPQSAGTAAEPGITVGRTGGAAAWTGLVVLGSALVTSWAVGFGVGTNRAYLGQLRARAEDLERERDQRAALAVAAERGRISREMHDVVAHGLSVMVIQAQGAATALDERPADTRAALGAIVATGRASLGDMRRVLAAVGEVDDSWHPRPGLAQLPDLVAQVRRAGTPVRLQVDGDPPPLPSTVDLSAYRIVQEALTNVIKHAGTGAAARVRLSYREAAVGIEVSDDGPGPTTGADGGSGLRGMRERATLLGGHFAAGAGAAGGFTVRATLPVHGSTA
jgi:signal transduction histidine kinase